jgi:hypothetical protein
VLCDRAAELLADRDAAADLGWSARAYARERFGLERFLRDWDAVFAEVVG